MALGFSFFLNKLHFDSCETNTNSEVTQTMTLLAWFHMHTVCLRESPAQVWQKMCSQRPHLDLRGAPGSRTCCPTVHRSHSQSPVDIQSPVSFFGQDELSNWFD